MYIACTYQHYLFQTIQLLKCPSKVGPAIKPSNASQQPSAMAPTLKISTKMLHSELAAAGSESWLENPAVSPKRWLETQLDDSMTFSHMVILHR